MQISKAGVVAAGAAATIAVMGSAATAAPAKPARTDAGQAATTTLAIGKALRGKAAPTARINDAPKQALITIGVGSSITALPWQICGSTAVAGLGGTAAASSPHTMAGDCANANTLLQQNNTLGLISILDDSAVNLLPWQVCGSHVVAGVGLTAAANSPALVTGDCHNANTQIEAPDDAMGDTLLSILSGSVVNVLPWQVCGSSAVMGVGAVAAANSPTTVLGDCTNAGIRIDGRDDVDAPLLGNTQLNLLPLQVCETNGLASLVGLVVPLNSPAYVGGDCYTPDGLPDDLDLG